MQKMRAQPLDTNIDQIIKITEKKDKLKSEFIEFFNIVKSKDYDQDVIDTVELTTYLKTNLPQIRCFDEQFLYRLFDTFFQKRNKGWRVTQHSIDLFFVSILNHLDI